MLKVKDFVVGKTKQYKNAGGTIYKIEGDRIYLKGIYGNKEDSRSFPANQFKKSTEKAYKKKIYSESKKKLSVPEKHQLKIAKKTLKMSDVGASVMGGMTKPEAKKFLKSVGYTDKEIKKLDENKLNEEKYIVTAKVKTKNNKRDTISKPMDKKKAEDFATNLKNDMKISIPQYKVFSDIKVELSENKMTIKRSRLNEIIKEELQKLTESKLSKATVDIKKIKSQLGKKWKSKGAYENFGQKEVGKLEDKHIDSSDYSTEMNTIRKAIQDFDKWAMDYNG